MIAKSPVILDTLYVQDLANRFKGHIIQPQNAEYDTARRVWNGLIDRYPALIVRPVDVHDVVAAVNFTRKHDLVVSVRGGGHNVAGHATNDGGIVIDFCAMKHIEIDPEARIAQAQAGVTWGELDEATQAHGLATPGGVYSKTGIAGLTLGGGYGWLRNNFGLSADNLLGAEMVTADGQIVYANAAENPDLLWGLRGGGGNFGVVTRFDYQLHPVGPEVMFVFTYYDASDEVRARDAARFYRDFSLCVPDNVSSLFALGVISPDEHYPQAIHNRPFAVVGAMYAGPVEEGMKVLQPLREFDTPMIDASGVQPYIQAQHLFDHEFPEGRRYYWKSLNVRQLDELAIALIVQRAQMQPSPYSTTDLWHIGGAVKRFGSDHGAYYGRDAAFLVNAEANWDDPADDAANIGWVRNFVSALEPFSDGSRYLNFAGFQEEGDAMMRAAFGTHYDRLVALKRRYDPHNLFRLNQNIRP